MSGAFQSGAFQADAFQITGTAPTDAFQSGAFHYPGFQTSPSATPDVDAFQSGAFHWPGFQTSEWATEPPPEPEPETPRGGSAFRDYAYAGARRRRKGEKTEAELRAEHYAKLYAELDAEAAKEAGLADSPEKAAAEARDGEGEPSGVRSPAAVTLAPAGSLAGLGSALLDKLLTLPADQIRVPVEPFPRILSKGRAAAIEAARLHAIRIRDDEEAVAALLLTSLF